MIDLRPCAYACVYVDPVLTSQRYDISISTRTTNMSFFSCAYAYACVAAVFTCLQGVRVLMLMLMCSWKRGLSFEGSDNDEKTTKGPLIRGKIRRVLDKTRTFRINGTFRLK